jgi:predicted NAD/FAD-dependent oxidoreductase
MTYVIVGAGLAGARAAEALRDGGYEGPVVRRCAGAKRS